MITRKQRLISQGLSVMAVANFDESEKELPEDFDKIYKWVCGSSEEQIENAIQEAFRYHSIKKSKQPYARRLILTVFKKLRFQEGNENE